MSQQMIDLIVSGTWETLYMTLVSTLIAYVIGVPIGIVLYIPGEGGIRRNRAINLVVGIVVWVVVIVGAAGAYNVLAPGAQPQSLQTQGEATQRVGDGTGESGPDGAAGSTDGAGGASGEDADAGKTAAPDFEMTAVDGGKVSLDDLKGKPVVLNFWASTCGPCKMEMPEFQAAYEQYGDQLQFVMLNVPDFNGETRERALQLVEQSGYTFPVYFDDTTQGQVLYGITSIPQTYFINADGTVEAYASGAIDASTLERGIEMVLA